MPLTKPFPSGLYDAHEVEVLTGFSRHHNTMGARILNGSVDYLLSGLFVREAIAKILHNSYALKDDGTIHGDFPNSLRLIDKLDDDRVISEHQLALTSKTDDPHPTHQFKETITIGARTYERLWTFQNGIATSTLTTYEPLNAGGHYVHTLKSSTEIDGVYKYKGPDHVHHTVMEEKKDPRSSRPTTFIFSADILPNPDDSSDAREAHSWCTDHSYMTTTWDHDLQGSNSASERANPSNNITAKVFQNKLAHSSGDITNIMMQDIPNDSMDYLTVRRTRKKSTDGKYQDLIKELIHETEKDGAISATKHIAIEMANNGSGSCAILAEQDRPYTSLY